MTETNNLKSFDSAEITIRNATINDLPFVASLYSEGASGGHFAEQPNVATENMIRDWQSKQAITRYAVRQDGVQRIEAVPINFWIADVNDQPAGFLITSPEEPDSTRSIEIYVMGIAKERRRQGIATKLILHAENNYPSSTSFYARCYPKSTWAIAMLRNLNYRIENISPTSRIHYLRKI